jgi:phosphoesterase RecJ-like protein
MKTGPSSIERILEAIDENQTFCIIGHQRPDGDCIGSQLGLTIALRNEGKEVSCWNQDPVPQKLKFLDGKKVVQRPKENEAFDCVICVDSANPDQLGRTAEFVRERRMLINIDHHSSNTRYGDINWISSRSPSTGEMIYRLMREGGWHITPRIADCLFTAMSTDTGSFQNSNTQPETFTAAGDLLEKGADVSRISDEVYQSYPLSRVRLLKHVYNHFRLIEDNQIGYFWLKLGDFTRTGSDPTEVEGLIDHIRNIDDVVLACMFEELEPNVTRISLRSKSKQINVAEVAKQLGGGGHQALAGARMTGKPMTVQRKVIAALRKALKAADKKN